MAKYSYSFSCTDWENRKGAEYTPAGERTAEGVTVDAYGRSSMAANYEAPPPPVKFVEEDGPVVYIQYAGAAAVIRIVEG